MQRPLISRKTQIEFRECLVGWGTLRTIEDLFEAHGFERIPLPEEELPGGQRRDLVECYYASVDWSSPAHARRVLDAYEDVLLDVGETHPQTARLLKYLQRDGYQLVEGRLVSETLDVALVEGFDSTDLDTAHLAVYLERIKASAATDPALAIGSTKELVEATLKTVLEGMGQPYDDRKEDIPALLKKAQKALDLVPGDVDDAKRGAEIIRKVLSNLSAVAVGIAELRNLYGTGHGKGTQQKGLAPRHSRLAVAAGAALCSFLLETLEHRAALEEKEGTEPVCQD